MSEERHQSQQCQMVSKQHFTLLELLDRLLDKGVVVKGEILLSVADIDLIYLNLGLLLSSVKTVELASKKGPCEATEMTSWSPAGQEELLDKLQPEENKADRAPGSLSVEHAQSTRADEEMNVGILPSTFDYAPDPFTTPKNNIDPKSVEKGLTRLVLTLVDLIRKLMEKQAIRRIDAGQVSFREVEGLGNTFFLLDQRMEQLKRTFGLQDEDLNLDLGPLGELL